LRQAASRPLPRTLGLRAAVSPPPYPNSRTAIIDARVVAVCWLLLGLLPVTFLASQAWPEGTGALFPANLVAFLLTGLLHVGLSFAHACPACGKHPTAQGFKPVHPKSVGQSVMSGWSGVVVNILLRRRLVCIHCGAEYRV
jgi:hypothetical protein